ESLARQFWPGDTDVLGKRIEMPGRQMRVLTVTGVVRDVRQNGMEERARPMAYVNAGPMGGGQDYFVMRSRLSPRATIAAAREVAAKLDPGLAIFDVQSLKDRLDRSLGPRRAWTLLFAMFGLTGLALAAAGIYGVVSYSVSLRTREIGIRMAIGARSRE